MRLRYLLRFAIEGDLRFISHKDTLRMFERVLIRSDLPVGYSEGFNPRVRLWLPLPRSVGISAADEVLIFEVTEELEPASTLARMQERSPAGLRLHDLQPMTCSIRPRPVRAHYEISLTASGSSTGSAPADDEVIIKTLANTIERFNSSTSWPIQRAAPARSKAAPRQLDLRPLVEQLETTDDSLRFVLPVLQTGSARPREVLDMLDLPAERWAHRLRRVRIEWDPPLTA